ncbi:MAG: hypothetical protein HQK76_18715 [Desulfobacterales bacterium]|nr:hypothetical protein [Desulfobacterales bacterium]
MKFIFKTIFLFCLTVLGLFTIIATSGNERINNNAPTVKITSPYSATASPTTFKYGEYITFSGTATDSEDGYLSDGSLVWTSNMDGQIGKGSNLTVRNLTVGTHVITLTATDREGASGSAYIKILYGSSFTVAVTVIAPTSGATAFNAGTCITFEGQAFDQDGSNLTGGSLVWTTNESNAPIDIGNYINVCDLISGKYIITCTAYDSSGASASNAVAITINQ